MKDKKVTVVGLGNSGVNAAILLRSLGAFVMATDSQDSPSLRKAKSELESKGISVEVGGHTEGFVRRSSLVVVSPGVEASSPALAWAARQRIPVIGEMELGFRFCKGRVIAITGTNGKSTVTSLIGKILKDSGKDAVVCGNIGNSLCGELNRIGKDTYVVLEVSSFQLERVEKFKPHIAIILNITDDHMDRYARFEDYFNEKLKVFRNQDENDMLILNYDAENLRPLAGMARSRVLFYSRVKEGAMLQEKMMRLKGAHNIENALASFSAGRLCGVSEESMWKTVSGFNTLPHRFETVAVIAGIEYIDDSKGTTVDSTRRALESCAKPVILIAGGKDKGSDYSAVRDTVKAKARAVVLIGEAAPAIKKALGPYIRTCNASDMPAAVRMAREMARPGDIVMLSPMCSSFDMFSSYRERGEVFAKSVKDLRAGQSVSRS